MTIFKTVSVLVLALAFIVPASASAAVGGSAARQLCVNSALLNRTNAISAATSSYTSSLVAPKQLYTTGVQTNRTNWQTAHNTAKAITAPAARATALQAAENKFKADNLKTTQAYKKALADVTAAYKVKLAAANTAYTNAAKVCPK